ncbi:MAG: hypothetical protein IGR76_10850 [Synechococcales cyanobacterium T60_A2020_003]|nr:hypothetical protein [Synechococcales cyanobacterium T60_A2020_003]
MARPVNHKCKHCATLSAEEAIALHGEEGDGCWNPRDSRQLGYDCHRRRHHYRYRAEHNAHRKLLKRRRDRLMQSATDQVTPSSGMLILSPPPIPKICAAVLVLYRQAADAPVHAVAAEVWQGDRLIAGIPAVHCMGMRGDEVGDYIRQMLALLQQFGISRFEDVVKEVPVHGCPIVPCPYTQD